MTDTTSVVLLRAEPIISCFPSMLFISIVSHKSPIFNLSGKQWLPVGAPVPGRGFRGYIHPKHPVITPFLDIITLLLEIRTISVSVTIVDSCVVF